MDSIEFQAAIEAVDLTATDARAQILALNEGLMNSNNTLLTESKANKTAATEAAEATDLARQAAATAKEQELIANGKTDELKLFYETQLADKTAALQVQTDTAVNALMSRDKGSVIGEILSKVDDRYLPLVKTQLNLDTSISYGENGEVKISIKHGDDAYSSVSEFLDGVKETEWKHYLKATSLSGAGTKQSTGGSSQKSMKDLSTAERLEFKQRDPEGFKIAANLN